MKRRHERGFSLIELCVTLIVISVLVRLSLPYMRNYVLNARAAEAAAYVMQIRSAAMQYNAEVGGWPAETAAGTIPPGLAPYLPAKFTFTRKDYQLDWDNWLLPGGTAGVLIGVSVVTTEKRLGKLVLGTLGKNSATFTTGNSYTYIMFGTSTSANDL